MYDEKILRGTERDIEEYASGNGGSREEGANGGDGTVPMLVIDEFFKDGVIVKRLINGVEVPLGDFPDDVKIQFFKGVRINQTMSVKDAKKIYGNFIGSKGE